MTVGEESASFQLNHLPFDDTDFHGMKLVLEDWASKGFVGDLNVEAATRGYITITTRNWVANHDDPYVSFELHKLKGKKRLLWQGTNWVARIFTCQNQKGAFATLHGCVSASTLIYTMNEVPNRGWNGVEFGRWQPLESYYLY